MMAGRRERPPKHSEERKECRSCGHRTVHVYDYGLNRFICSKCELNQDRETKDERQR